MTSGKFLFIFLGVFLVAENLLSSKVIGHAVINHDFLCEWIYAREKGHTNEKGRQATLTNYKKIEIVSMC